MCFLVALCHLVIRRKNLKVKQEAFPSAGKNAGLVLVPCCSWKCVPAAISGGVDIFWVPWCHLL